MGWQWTLQSLIPAWPPWPSNYYPGPQLFNQQNVSNPNVYPANYGHKAVQIQADQEVKKLNQKLSGEPQSSVKPEPVVLTATLNCTGSLSRKNGKAISVKDVGKSTREQQE